MHPDDRVRTQEQAEALKDQIRDIDSRDTNAAESLDRGMIQKRLQKAEAILEKDDGLVAKGVQKDRLAKRAEEIEKELKENMPTHDEMWAKSGTVEMERAVRKNQDFENRYGDKVREWQDIQRRLEPEDSTHSYVERIRPSK